LMVRDPERARRQDQDRDLAHGSGLVRRWTALGGAH
jgi:hypothetical protein